MSAASDALAALDARGWTLGVAESLTGGALCSALVGVPGASAVLLGGVVAYATPVKHTLLGVDADLLDTHGAVHPEVAAQMARGVRSAVAIGGRSADVGVSTTGIAGPDSPDGQPVGTVHIGVATPVVEVSRAFVFTGDRAAIRAQTVDAALAILRELVGE
ncbi:CinA family protein [Microbacterium sp. NPDC057944]|uniref:CinA family protein n=1 Tax=Microbacterium sp. NPDC057944 TaxID=3346286 RepID=UPI0036DE0FC2